MSNTLSQISKLCQSTRIIVLKQKNKIMRKEAIIAGNSYLDDNDRAISGNLVVWHYLLNCSKQDIVFFIDQHHNSLIERYVSFCDWAKNPIIPLSNFFLGDRMGKMFPFGEQKFVVLENSLRKYAKERQECNYENTLLNRSMFDSRMSSGDVVSVCNCKGICLSMFEILLEKYEKVTWILENLGGRTRAEDAIAAANLFGDRVSFTWIDTMNEPIIPYSMLMK